MASCASPVVPISPLGAAIDAIDGFTGEERDVFFSSLDQLPNFDSPTPPAPEDNRFSYDIEEDDWKWLATQVGGRTQQELAQFAHAEYERMALEDPDLAELAKMGAGELGGENLEEQIAACQELTRFAEHFDAPPSEVDGACSSSSCGSGSKRSSEVGNAGGAADDKKKRERGNPWTEDEHKLFLIGLDKFGKGDWRNIARQCVLTRNPAQVASHAQKYFIRQDLHGDDEKMKNRRVSIHDISSQEQILPARNQRKRKKGERAAAKAEAAAAATPSGGTSAPSCKAVGAASPGAAAAPATPATVKGDGRTDAVPRSAAIGASGSSSEPGPGSALSSPAKAEDTGADFLAAAGATGRRASVGAARSPS